MTAYIKKSGTLVIVAENETEEWAISQWMKECVGKDIAWTVISGDEGTRMTGRIEKRQQYGDDSQGHPGTGE